MRLMSPALFMLYAISCGIGQLELNWKVRKKGRGRVIEGVIEKVCKTIREKVSEKVKVVLTFSKSPKKSKKSKC